MASPDQAPEEPTTSSPAQEVVEYFLDQQAKSPEYMHALAERLWDELTPAQRDARTAAQAAFFPDDIAGRQNAIHSQLVIEYIEKEGTLSNQLERAFNEPGQSLGALDPHAA